MPKSSRLSTGATLEWTSNGNVLRCDSGNAALDKYDFTRLFRDHGRLFDELQRALSFRLQLPQSATWNSRSRQRLSPGEY